VLRNAYYVLSKATRSKHDGGARHQDINKKWPRKYPKDLRGQRLVAGVKTPKPRNV